MTNSNEPHDPSTCSVCPEGRGEKPGWGWTPIDGRSNHTHCRGCGDTWSGANTNHCKGCHLTFTSVDAGYRLHTDAGHPDPASVGLVSQENRYGTIEWGTAEGFAARAAFAARRSGATQDTELEE